MQKTWVQSLNWEDPLEKEMATHLQDSCLENSTDRAAWGATVNGVIKNRTQLKTHTHTRGILVPQPEIQPAPSASEDGFSTTEPPGKSLTVFFPDNLF